MYTEFFGLRELPFNNTPDPRFFYSTPDHEEALASLIYAVKQRKGFVLLTGEVGAGKTLVSRMMLRRFGTGIAFANINHTVHTAGDLMESLCMEFELPVEPGMSHTQLVRVLHDFLLTKFAENQPVVLILDEAQNLPIAAFEQLRMIGNLEADDAKLLQIAIVGQPELQRLFQSPQLRQLKQRVFRSFHIPALDRKATEGYIRYRLSVAASARNDLFTTRAVNKIFEVSRGLPRLINTLCDNAMLSAYSADVRRIDNALIESVVSQMMTIGQVQPPPGTFTAQAPPLQGECPGEPVFAPAAQQFSGEFAFADRRIAGGQAQQAPIQAAFAWNAASATPPAAPMTSGQPGACPHAYGRPVPVQYPVRYAQPARPPVVPPDESTRRRNELRTRLTRTINRIRAFEGPSGRSTPVPPIATRAKGGSNSTTKSAESILGRVKAASQDLSCREEKLRGFSQTIRTVAVELGGLLDRLQKSSNQRRAEERSAKEVHDQLATQTEQARKVSEVLRQDTTTKLNVLRADKADASVIKTASAATDDTLATGIDKGPTSLTSGPVHRVLCDTRESLSDLRKLARATGGGGPSVAKEGAEDIFARVESPESAATARLAHHVENLVAMLDQ